jgi:hypothetical protein
MRLYTALRLGIFATFIGSSAPVLAWDGTTGGTITFIDVTTDNYGFRVTLAGSPALCGNQNTWAYITTTDSNYNAFAAALLSAKETGDGIVLYATRDASGYCHLGYISVH